MATPFGIHKTGQGGYAANPPEGVFVEARWRTSPALWAMRVRVEFSPRLHSTGRPGRQSLASVGRETVAQPVDPTALAFLSGVACQIGHNVHMAKPALNLADLSLDEKLELIDDLWTSIDFSELPLTPEQRSELDRRLDRLELEGPVGVPWEQVRAEMTTKP
jgi:putative addiction module component (TIGR02574 family)